MKCLIREKCFWVDWELASYCYRQFNKWALCHKLEVRCKSKLVTEKLMQQTQKANWIRSNLHYKPGCSVLSLLLLKTGRPWTNPMAKTRRLTNGNDLFILSRGFSENNETVVWESDIREFEPTPWPNLKDWLMAAICLGVFSKQWNRSVRVRHQRG